MVVSNTVLLRQFIAVDQADLITQVAEEVLIPPAVFIVISYPSICDDVQRWIERYSAWLQTRELQSQSGRERFSILDQDGRKLHNRLKPLA